MWSIESNEGFNIGICGSRSVEEFRVFSTFFGDDYTSYFRFVPRMCQELYWSKKTADNTKTNSILIAIFILVFLGDIFFFNGVH